MMLSVNLRRGLLTGLAFAIPMTAAQSWFLSYRGIPIDLEVHLIQFALGMLLGLALTFELQRKF
jgi:hypothetical protein